MKRFAGVLAAVAVALGVSAGMAGAAPAARPAGGGATTNAVQIPTGVDLEIWLPYVTPTRPHCLEAIDPGFPDLPYAQIFNCHASDGHGDQQLWQFVALGGGSYWLVNKKLGNCLRAFNPQKMEPSACQFDPLTQWHVVQSAYDPNGFNLVNDYWGQCLSSDGVPSSSNGSHGVRLFGCNNTRTFNGDVQIQTWRLG